jgi:hypothetical protein
MPSPEPPALPALPALNGITDSHAHVYWKSFDADRDEVLAPAPPASSA